MDLALSHLYDAQASCYDIDHADPVSEWENQKLRAALHSSITDPVNTILDLGCGSGLFADLMGTGFLAGRHLTGVDFSTEMLAIHRNKMLAAGVSMADRAAEVHNPELQGSSFEAIFAPMECYRANRDFDAVVSLFALQHCNTREDWFPDLLRSCNLKRGFLMFAASLIDRVADYEMRATGFPVGKGYYRSSSSVSQQLENAGFEVKIRGFNALFHPRDRDVPDPATASETLFNNEIERDAPDLCQYFIATIK